MTSARLLFAILVMCSLPAFTQDQPVNAAPTNAAPALTTDANRNTEKISEPWKMILAAPADGTSNPMDHIRVDQYRVDQGSSDLLRDYSKSQPRARTLLLGMDGQPESDTTCFTMRSYVVARDSPDSDSTHMTGYSTCQPTSRYRLKTTEERSVLLER
jgi:hypothetical protein